MEYKIPVNKENLVKAILKVVNFSLKLTDQEIDILAILINNKITVINTNARDLIRKISNKDKYSTNNYIKALKDKNVLLTKSNTKDLYVNPNIETIVKSKSIKFTFDLK